MKNKKTYKKKSGDTRQFLGKPLGGLSQYAHRQMRAVRRVFRRKSF